MAALLLAWVYIFDTVQRERERLESPREGIVNAVPREDLESGLPPSTLGTGPRTASAPKTSASQQPGRQAQQADNVGHEVDVPAEVLLDSSVPLSDVYAEVTGDMQASCCADAGLHGTSRNVAVRYLCRREWPCPLSGFTKAALPNSTKRCPVPCSSGCAIAWTADRACVAFWCTSYPESIIVTSVLQHTGLYFMLIYAPILVGRQ